MSWDKNTISFSKLGAVKEVLDDLIIPYEVSTIATFRGRGLNDDFFMDGTDTIHELRRLQYGNKVILEYVELDADCDVDDIICSQQFNLGNEPKEWEAIKHTDKCGDHSEILEEK